MVIITPSPGGSSFIGGGCAWCLLRTHVDQSLGYLQSSVNGDTCS